MSHRHDRDHFSCLRPSNRHIRQRTGCPLIGSPVLRSAIPIWMLTWDAACREWKGQESRIRTFGDTSSPGVVQIQLGIHEMCGPLKMCYPIIQECNLGLETENALKITGWNCSLRERHVSSLSVTTAALPGAVHNECAAITVSCKDPQLMKAYGSCRGKSTRSWIPALPHTWTPPHLAERWLRGVR